MAHKVLRTSAWLNDAGIVEAEVVWTNDDDVKFFGRFYLTPAKARSFALKLRVAASGGSHDEATLESNDGNDSEKTRPAAASAHHG